MTTSNVAGGDLTPKAKLVGILALSYVLRIWLAAGGGQLFWPDESRYSSAQKAAKAIAGGQWHEVLAQLFGHADHVLFRLASLPAALLEQALGSPHPMLVSAYFSLFSVGLIFLVWAVARRARASETEALWAAFFAAASNCLFFYARHFLPYDVALSILFLAFWFGLGSYSAVNSALVGVVVALGILCYNGYWLLGFTIAVLHVLFGPGSRQMALRRGFWSAIGFCGVVADVLSVGHAVYPNLIADYGSFSGTIKQGDFHLGYRVIAEYLWYSERALVGIWVAAIGYALWAPEDPSESRRLKIWLAGAGIVAVGLIVFSDVIPQFMVYGRLTREVVPFLCLAAGLGMNKFLGKRSAAVPGLAPWVAALVVCVAAANFETPLVQDFPDAFNERARRVIAQQRAQDFGFFPVLFAEPLWGKRLSLELPPHMELMRSPHPMQFRPFQYEGFSAALRREINANDVAMQVLEIPFQPNADSTQWRGLPGPVRIRLKFRPDYWGEEEPLVSAGDSNNGDLAVVRYLDPGHLALGLVRTGRTEIFSDPIPVDYGKFHEILISEGAFFPGPGSPLYKESPELDGLRSRLVVILDDVVVLSQHAESYQPTPTSLNWGVNATGALTPQPFLRSPVYEFGAAPLDKVATAVPTLAAFRMARARPPEWQGALGPIRLRFTLAAPTPEVTAEPLLSINGPGTKDVVFISRVGSDHVRIGFDRMGAGAILSEPLRLSGTGTEELDVSLGSLMPSADSAVYTEYPSFAPMRSEVYLRFNGIVTLHTPVSFAPAQAHWFTLGANTIGSSTYGQSFRGILSYFGTIGPENILGIGTRLADIAGSPDKAWDGFTGPIRLSLTFPRGRSGHREPLLSSGKKDASDTLFVQYDSDTRVRFGYARSGVPPVLSTPATVVPGQMQELLLGSGALMPPEKSDIYAAAPDNEPLRYFIHVGLNGRPLLHEFTEPHAAGRDAIWVGSNPLSEPTIDRDFTGTIESLTRPRPSDMFEEGALAGKLARDGWGGYPGPLRIRVLIPIGLPGEGQPLVTTGLRGIGDVIFLRYEANGKARIGQDHWGSSSLLSEPFVLDTTVSHTVDISLGGLFPPADSAFYISQPNLSGPRAKTIVLLDGRLVLDAQEESHPSMPARITVGANLIGGTTARSLFSGDLKDVELAPLSAFPP
jgi:hypothetical protein